MAFLEKDKVCDAYDAATKEADQWREDYPEFERLADNRLIGDLDESLPKVNDGSLAAALFKLPKRIVSSDLTGRAKALDRDDAWLTELANLQWENNIVPNANMQAPFHRKWKDAVRKAAIYGGQPIITLFQDDDKYAYSGADIIVPQATDVKLEAGKVSDYDSDVIFWDVYYTRTQFKTMIEQAEQEMKDKDPDNKWDVKTMKEILKAKPEDDRPGNEEHSQKLATGIKKTGIHFFIAFQRGVEAPFAMYQKSYKDKPIHEWKNPDPTGDMPVHYLYCYQDFINPYGTGIVKLAGGLQNVLDYYTQADVLSTQLGTRPPKLFEGDTNDTDWDSFTYTEDADWLAGNAKVTRMEMADGVYQGLPNRVEMMKSRLNNILPMGDTSVSAAAGDPTQSKTPAGVKQAAAMLSIDDDDFKDNLYMTYAAVAKNMINTHFANMQGSDAIKVTDEERELLSKSGIDFPVDEMGEPTNELVIEWENARGTFDFEVNPEEDKSKDEAQQMDGLMTVAEIVKDPTLLQMAQSGPIMMGSKKSDVGELLSTMISFSTDNDKIVTEVTPEEMEQQEMMAQQAAMQPQVDPATGQPIQPEMGMEQPMAPEEQMPVEGEVVPQEGMEEEVTPEQAEANMQAVMEQYNVDPETAAAMLEAERQGWSDEEIQDAFLNEQEPANV